MNFSAVNTKIKAMRASLLTARDYERLCAETGEGYTLIKPEHDFAKIAAYVSKPVRDFLRNAYIPSLYGETCNTSKMFAGISSKHGKDSLKRVIGTETDLRNILWIYRLKKYHKINGDAVFSFLNPSSHRLCAAEVSQLARARDMESFAQAVSGGFYGGVFGNLSDFTRGEQKLTGAVRSQFQKEYRHENLAVVCGHLYARHLETKNIRAIAQGKKNELSSQEIFSLLHI
ncbi:MAG: V-type ATPase subunit [Defluviitaleaceae bacterium]|nr:V-type ATPase subunit [Defluviitaleaceae bacterium]MCL2263820.1 V-type ATPase subunit [Defluviitaleaceae bacterium]